MPFTIGTLDPARLPGDFRIAPAQAHTPSDAERTVLDNIMRALDQLAAQAAADARAHVRLSILQARVAFRTAQIAELRMVGDELVNGPADIAATADRSAEIARRVTASVPDVALVDTTPPRFAGEVRIAIVNYTPDQAEQMYFDAHQETIDGFAADEAADLRANYPDPALQARRAHRAEAVDKLKETFSFWKAAEVGADVAAANVSYATGFYAAQRARMKRKLFTVSAVRGTDRDDRYNVALDITVADGLPAPNDQPTQDQRDLYVEISRAETVVDAVCRQIRARAHSRWWRRAEEDQRGLRLLGEYIDKLVGIARIGLEQPHTQLAKLAINSLREEFVAREAREILNRYVRRLGGWSFSFAALFLIVYIAARNYACDNAGPCDSWWYAHRSFLLAATGASLGTWASFSVRQINLTFEQLASPEEQLLDAPLRVIFVVVLTMAACLLFWTGAINLKIGELNTEASAFSKVGSVALLIGFFCGLSERALSSAIAGRATAFVGGIAGGR